MNFIDTFPSEESIFSDSMDFDSLKEAIWAYQYESNPVVRQFSDQLGRNSQFLPIRFFKDFEMKSGGKWKEEAVFESSGTTGQQTSKHFIRSLDVYKHSFYRCFERFYGQDQISIFALLPHYLERGNSSLIYMVKHLILKYGTPGSGFYLRDFKALNTSLIEAMERGEKVLLLGVTYALLDFAKQFPVVMAPGSIVMETGGMKGKRKELMKAEVHERLMSAFGVPSIHSEYGMTELMSQAYSSGKGRFSCPPWMKVVISDIHLPELTVENGTLGRINIIDLANIHSCSFISTDDLGRKFEDGSFEVTGRIDNSDLRGCNLMYQL